MDSKEFEAVERLVESIDGLDEVLSLSALNEAFDGETYALEDKVVKGKGDISYIFADETGSRYRIQFLTGAKFGKGVAKVYIGKNISGKTFVDKIDKFANPKAMIATVMKFFNEHLLTPEGMQLNGFIVDLSGAAAKRAAPLIRKIINSTMRSKLKVAQDFNPVDGRVYVWAHRATKKADDVFNGPGAAGAPWATKGSKKEDKAVGNDADAKNKKETEAVQKLSDKEAEEREFASDRVRVFKDVTKKIRKMSPLFNCSIHGLTTDSPEGLLVDKIMGIKGGVGNSDFVVSIGWSVITKFPLSIKSSVESMVVDTETSTKRFFNSSFKKIEDVLASIKKSSKISDLVVTSWNSDFKTASIEFRASIKPTENSKPVNRRFVVSLIDRVSSLDKLETAIQTVISDAKEQESTMKNGLVEPDKNFTLQKAANSILGMLKKEFSDFKFRVKVTKDSGVTNVEIYNENSKSQLAIQTYEIIHSVQGSIEDEKNLEYHLSMIKNQLKRSGVKNGRPLLRRGDVVTVKNMRNYDSLSGVDFVVGQVESTSEKAVLVKTKDGGAISAQWNDVSPTVDKPKASQSKKPVQVFTDGGNHRFDYWPEHGILNISKPGEAPNPKSSRKFVSSAELNAAHEEAKRVVALKNPRHPVELASILNDIFRFPSWNFIPNPPKKDEVEDSVVSSYKSVTTEDYQGREYGYPRSGVPDDIRLNGNSLEFSFKDTTESTSETWVKNFAKQQGLRFTRITTLQAGDYQDDWVEVILSFEFGKPEL